MKKKTKKIVVETLKCFKCGKEINKEFDRFVSLVTTDKGNIIDVVHFHILCWGEFNSDKVNERLGQMASAGFNILSQQGLI